jgi:Asp-tRNA(Asn)/Glu-tRNA(Gln) amidotransferase A subunit family amidase
VALPVNVDIEDQAGAARTLDALRFQFVLPVLGLPGLAVPTAPVDGLPMGVQVVSRRYREDVCLDAGEIIEAHLGACTPLARASEAGRRAGLSPPVEALWAVIGSPGRASTPSGS